MNIYYEISVYGKPQYVRNLFNLESTIGEVLGDGYIIHTYQPDYWIELIENDPDLGIDYITVKVQSKYYVNLSKVE